MNRVLARWTLLLIGSMVVGCQSASPDRETAAHADVRGIEHFAVSPLNLAVPMPLELEPAAASVARRIRIHLEARGHTVTVVSAAKGHELWGESMLQVEANADAKGFDAAAEVYARRVCAETGAESVILPSLVYRKGRHRFGNLRWDGVVRSLQAPQDAEGLVGVSIHAFVFDSSGVRRFSGFGGIDVVHRFDADDGLVLRDEVLDKPQHVREGIAMVLDRYLVQPRD